MNWTDTDGNRIEAHGAGMLQSHCARSRAEDFNKAPFTPGFCPGRGSLSLLHPPHGNHTPRTLSSTATFNVEPIQAMTTTVATVCSSPSASSTLTIRGAVMFLTVTPNRVDA